MAPFGDPGEGDENYPTGRGWIDKSGQWEIYLAPGKYYLGYAYMDQKPEQKVLGSITVEKGKTYNDLKMELK